MITYIITDWMSNVCFDSDSKEFTLMDDADIYLDTCLINHFADDYPSIEDCFDAERGEYYIVEYNSDTDKLVWTGTRYRYVENYYRDYA